MKREIKFRGKRIDNGEWLEGYYAYKEATEQHFIMVETLHHHPKYGSYFTDYEVDPETVGQYTGLKDGVSDEEWYEGDILSPNPHSTRTEVEVICFDSHQGKYKSVPLSLYCSNAGNGGWTGYEIKCYQKRLGNCWDNHELLEVQEDVR